MIFPLFFNLNFFNKTFKSCISYIHYVRFI